jgi:hypothetical protein
MFVNINNLYVITAAVIILIAVGALYVHYGISKQNINLVIGISVIFILFVCFLSSSPESQRFFLEKHNIILHIYLIFDLLWTKLFNILNLLIGLRFPEIFIVILKFLLWVVFFVGVSIAVLALFGVPIDIPFLNMGGGSSYNEDDTPDRDTQPNRKGVNGINDIFKDVVNTFQRSLNQSLGMGMDFANYEYKEREETPDGRCNETDYITDGNKCISNKKKKDLVWKLKFMNEDYNKLPEEFKKKNLESISIPYKEVGGVYIPDCKESYYSKTKKKTGLLTNAYDSNDNSYSCVYLHKNKVVYR